LQFYVVGYIHNNKPVLRLFLQDNMDVPVPQRSAFLEEVLVTVPPRTGPLTGMLADNYNVDDQINSDPEILCRMQPPELIWAWDWQEGILVIYHDGLLYPHCFSGV